jgi:hypothetical protein
MNKVVPRTRCPNKTIEDLVHLVNGATVFSKLEAFHQIEINKASGYATTITKDFADTSAFVLVFQTFKKSS